MDVETIRTAGLGDSTYVLSFDGVGLVVDPQRDIDRFEKVIDALEVDVRWVLDTHLHNDYVSGAKDIAAKLGAELVIPGGAAPAYRHRPAFHMEDIDGPGFTIRPIHTPGHTPEHMSYVVVVDGVEQAVFSGGSLLVGSAGRSDLLGMQRAESLARLQYISVNRLASLPDSTALYPTHGAGSFCTASITTKGASSIGAEKKTNPSLAHRDADSFVSSHLSGLVPFPAYYQHMGPANLAGLPPSDETPRPPVLNEEQFKPISSQVTVIDARPKKEFAAGHIPGSLGVELRDDFGVWVGWVAEFNSKLVLVVDPDQNLDEAIRQLARIGFDQVAGVVTNLSVWNMKLASHQIVDLAEFVSMVKSGPQMLDVRAPSEWDSGVIDESVLDYAPDVASRPPSGLDADQPVLIACGTGYRASVAASFLHRYGYKPVVLADAGVPEVLAALNK